MKILSRFVELCKVRGIKNTFQYSMQKIIGIERYDERIDTLNYFLNYYCKLSDFPKATGSLGKLQECDTILLFIVDDICKKHGFEYWLNAGTCLGAVRHSGFIPWDDDMDICMMRDTYENARQVLFAELKAYGIEANEELNEPIGRIGIGYKHHETGIWIDLLPAEYTNINPSDIDSVMKYKEACRKYSAKWKDRKQNMTREQAFEFRRKHIPEICSKVEAKSIIYCPELGLKPRLWAVDDIFPLQKIKFEGRNMPVPNHIYNYMIQFYGKNYMSFPQAGIQHHGNEFGTLSSWAERSGINMDTVISHLRETLTEIESEFEDRK